MTKWADTATVPPACGVMVSAVELPAGLIKLITVLARVVGRMKKLVSSFTPVARPIVDSA